MPVDIRASATSTGDSGHCFMLFIDIYVFYMFVTRLDEVFSGHSRNARKNINLKRLCDVYDTLLPP
ncbi:hypothetical protein BLOT_007816 [Blomia tropicalis]|nr:hypothetical protein BLOT_007816 [Blomia tropicalis]